MQQVSKGSGRNHEKEYQRCLIAVDMLEPRSTTPVTRFRNKRVMLKPVVT